MYVAYARVYTSPYVPSSLASRARETCPWVNDVSELFFREAGRSPLSQMVSLSVYNMPTVSTISRPSLLVVHSAYRLNPGNVYLHSVYMYAQCLQAIQWLQYTQCKHIYTSSFFRYGAHSRVHVYGRMRSHIYTCASRIRIRVYMRHVHIWIPRRLRRFHSLAFQVLAALSDPRWWPVVVSACAK